MNNVTTNQPDQNSCVYCFTSIPSLAKKCNSCGSFQTWKRHLGFMLSIISVFLGVTATLGIFYTPIKDSLRKDYDLKAIKLFSSHTGYTVSIENVGKKPIVISNARFFWGPTQTNLEWEGRPAIIPPGKLVFINMTYPKDKFNHPEFKGEVFSNEFKEAPCYLVLSGGNLSGELNHYIVKYQDYKSTTTCGQDDSKFYYSNDINSKLGASHIEE